jgi:hypothetical protein
MNTDNYSHILNIKIFCNKDYIIIENKSINVIVKNAFLNAKKTINNINLECRKKEWSLFDKQFNMGDIVIYSPVNSDTLLLQSVTETIYEIENKLHKKGLLLPSYQIIYKILKPISERSSV